MRLPLPGLRVRDRRALPGLRPLVPGCAAMSARRDLWCLVCGREASDPITSIDPAHPLVMCRWLRPDGIVAGCGRVVGSSDPGEVGRMVTANRRERATRQHASHARKGRGSPDCYTCHPDLVASHA